MNKPKLLFLIVLLIIGLVILLGFLYFFVFAETCETERCFLDGLENCNRATYISHKEGNIWKYTIQPSIIPGRKTCTVYVKNIVIASSTELAQNIQGKSMKCVIPEQYAGAFIEIHTKLEFCSGPLKEKLQDMLLERLYNYIIQHLGELSQEVRTV